MSQSDTDGYRILNFRHFWIRIGYGYAKIFSGMDQELKNQYPLTSDSYTSRNFSFMVITSCKSVAVSDFGAELVLGGNLLLGYATF